MAEWNEIVKYANKTSTKAARKKHYGVRLDGTKDFLSINEIKHKKKEMKDFDQQFKEHYIGSCIAGLVPSEIVASDPELLEEYKKMEREYYKDNRNNNLNQKDNS